MNNITCNHCGENTSSNEPKVMSYGWMTLQKGRHYFPKPLHYL